MTKSQTQNYLGPFITMVFLFFIVGFMTVVFQQFQEQMKIALFTEAQSIKNTLGALIVFTWFLAYPLTGGIGSNLVNKYAYRGTLVRALLIMVVGFAVCLASVLIQKYFHLTVKFSDAIVIPVSFFLFLIGTYIVGAAVTIMQVVINPYLIACNVKGTSDVQRQNIGGSCNSIGTTIAPYFVGGIVFGGAAAAGTKLDGLIIPFIVFMVVVTIIAFVVNKLQLPNIKGTTSEGEKLDRSIWSFRHLVLGVVAIFIYVGVEVAVGTNIVSHATATGFSYVFNLFGFEISLTPVLLASLYWFSMLVGRLIGSTLSKVSAKTQLLFTSIFAIIFLFAAMTTHLVFLIPIGLCHSIMWPAIFSLAIRGLGKYTSAGTGALMIGVLGGGIIPLIQSGLVDWMGSWNLAWIVVIVGEAYLLYYAMVGSKISKKDNMVPVAQGNK